MPEKSPKLILFATYWNAVDWIYPSLNQIEQLSPDEVIICDGCFDDNYPVASDDGTREIIQEYVDRNKGWKFVEAVRRSKIHGLYSLFRGSPRKKTVKLFSPVSIYELLRAFRCHKYRINQALTFNYMISISSVWSEGHWFMTYDADQFYDDDVVDAIFNRRYFDEDISLLTARERTFFEGFDTYTTEYEKRNYNNLPHRILPNTAIIPTRDLVIEQGFRPKRYLEQVKSKELGWYNHYKIVSMKRYSETYRVGDRKEPDYMGYHFNKYNRDHPAVVSSLIINSKKIGG